MVIEISLERIFLTFRHWVYVWTTQSGHVNVTSEWDMGCLWSNYHVESMWSLQ